MQIFLIIFCTCIEELGEIKIGSVRRDEELEVRVLGSRDGDNELGERNMGFGDQKMKNWSEDFLLESNDFYEPYLLFLVSFVHIPFATLTKIVIKMI
jgi:hypothetical protein